MHRWTLWHPDSRLPWKSLWRTTHWFWVNALHGSFVPESNIHAVNIPTAFWTAVKNATDSCLHGLQCHARKYFHDNAFQYTAWHPPASRSSAYAFPNPCCFCASGFRQAVQAKSRKSTERFENPKQFAYFCLHRYNL